MTPLFEGLHFYVEEIACPCCGRVWPDLYTDPIYLKFFWKLEATRTEWGAPLVIAQGAGARCPLYQLGLFKQQKTTAIISPHLFLAVDVDFETKPDVLRFVDIVESLYPELRLGYKGYLDQGKTFVHMDEAYLVAPKHIGSEFWVRGLRF